MPQDFHFEENVKGHKNLQCLKLSTPCPTCHLHKIKKILERPKYETAFSTVFRAACRWTDLKGSKHLDLWMLAIIYKEPFTAVVHHYRSCYHTYTQLSCKSQTLHEAAERQSDEELFTAIRNKLMSNPQVLLMINTASWLITLCSPTVSV